MQVKVVLKQTNKSNRAFKEHGQETDKFQTISKQHALEVKTSKPIKTDREK